MLLAVAVMAMLLFVRNDQMSLLASPKVWAAVTSSVAVPAVTLVAMVPAVA